MSSRGFDIFGRPLAESAGGSPKYADQLAEFAKKPINEVTQYDRSVLAAIRTTGSSAEKEAAWALTGQWNAHFEGLKRAEAEKDRIAREVMGKVVDELAASADPTYLA